ncbi:MAG TPA: hypothetical protein VF720_05060 [Candidatus Eisenbacteria bacterium]
MKSASLRLSPGYLRPRILASWMSLAVLLPALALLGCDGQGPVARATGYPDSLGPNITRLLIVDFGDNRLAPPGMLGIGSRTRHAVCGWSSGMIREVVRRDTTDKDLADFVEGEDATFVLAVRSPDHPYEVVLTLGDPETARGPMSVSTRDVVVASGIRTKPGQYKQVRFRADAPDRRITFRVRGGRCELFALTSLAVYGPLGSKMPSLAQTGPRDARPFVPRPDSLATLGPKSDPRRILGTFADFLVAQEPVEGGFSYTGIWYQNAYPVRTLLAAGRILDRPELVQEAFRVLDRFVDEQHADGRWTSSYFGRPECAGRVVADASSANFADIGSMAHALAVGAGMADGDRRARYIEAARRYADEVVLPDQMADGAFPNRLYAGKDFPHPYSVATATQASSLAALAIVTGEARYRNAAEKAGQWLAERMLPSGFIVFHPHDADQPRLIRARDFGDSFYLVEGLIWVHRAAADAATRDSVGAALRRHLWGPAGLKASTIHGYWWEPPGVWNASKTGGLLEAVAWAREDSPGAEVDRWIQLSQAWLADPLLRQRIGATSLLFMPNGEFSLVATGFAGVGVASVIDFNAIFPVPRVTETPMPARVGTP